MGRRWWPATLIVLLLGGASCGDQSSTTDPADGALGGVVLVSAAASLTDAFAGVASVFEAANPGVDVQLNLAASSALREQILEGAPADVFASANEATMTDVVEGGEATGVPRAFARNRLQIAVPAGNPGGVAGLEDFADRDLLIGLCSAGVPCGDLAREALAGAGVEAAIDTNEPDVRALLTKIEADELDAGIVYVTDVAGSGELVEGIDIPADVNVEAVYEIATLAASPNPRAAAAFVEYVLSDEGRAILAGHGFIAP